MKYVFKGRRQGFEISPTDEVKRCADGYTEVRRNNECVGVYLTALLVEAEPQPVSSVDPAPHDRGAK